MQAVARQAVDGVCPERCGNRVCRLESPLRRAPRPFRWLRCSCVSPLELWCRNLILKGNALLLSKMNRPWFLGLGSASMHFHDRDPIVGAVHRTFVRSEGVWTLT